MAEEKLFSEGQKHYTAEQFDDALKFFSLALEKNPRDFKSLFARALTYSKLKRHPDVSQNISPYFVFCFVGGCWVLVFFFCFLCFVSLSPSAFFWWLCVVVQVR